MKETGAWESAAEERHRKLLEYLAAKGKLKPPNPKPYLRDTTNHPPAARVQSIKAGVIARQKENLHIISAKPKNGSAELPKKTRGPLPPPSKTPAPETLQNVPQKPVAKVHSRPLGSSTRNVAQKGSGWKQERLGSALAQGLQSAAGVSKVQVFGNRERSKTATLRSSPIQRQVKNLFQIERQPLNSKHAEKRTAGVSNNDAIIRDPLIKTKNNREQVRRVSAAATAPITGHKNTVVSRTTLRSSTARSTCRNGARCTDEKSSSRHISMAAFPPRHARKPQVPTGPPPRKALAAAVCRTQPSEKLQSERKVAKVKPIMGAAKNGCSSSGKTWSTIRTERTKNTKVPAKPTAAACVMKNNTNMCVKPNTKTETVVSTLLKSDDPIPRRHSLGTTESAAYGRSECRGPLPVTPALWASSVPPRKAMTEMKPSQDSKNLSAKEIRRSKLQEWMNSKGKSYKRPPMTLPSKKPAKAKARLSFWAGIEEEDDLNSLAVKINMTLTDCLRLIDEGLPSETVEATLSKIPQGEKFAKYWMCKARLLERCGTFDVIGLYEQAVRCGAVPIEELRETIFDIMKNTNKKAKAVTFDLVPDEGLTARTEIDSCEAPALPQKDETVDPRSPNILTRHWTGKQGSALKFQIAPLPSRVKETTVAAGWKVLTPVRRSLRIERSVSRYPEPLMEHDTVVASLNDLLDADESCFVYRQNEALPMEVDSKIRAL
ncbi:hypothetical protein NDU88_004883 [Pleurodeles waltl]|uniref:Cytoskeleton-associated protein 2 C-terminal domain-containing protein n=1 Tax=Pleurodeles waltl TaxID=8319 RepID=A0AAV7LJZ8_PLEWA|nr:hypothetical protein NDU88_004883 [Pleurodeles waltl]